MTSPKNNLRKIMLPAASLLANSGKLYKHDEDRAAMTMTDRDERIPRVKDAGQTKVVGGAEVQVMHNGLLVAKNGYQEEWQAEVIEKLKGVHEPQEEKVFYEVLKRLDPGGTMIELGSWWSYYSLWFLKALPGGRAICCEPDPDNLKIGKLNAKLNGFKSPEDVIFLNAAAGSDDGKLIQFQNTEGKQRRVKVPIRSVDGLVEEQKVDKLDILHMDIQGIELGALQGAIESIKAHKVRFVFISTHHYLISGDPLTHLKCLEFIKNNGGSIIAKHAVLESSSGDGLIVASFDPRDKDFKVPVSLRSTDDSFFRPYEYDIDILWTAHDQLIAKMAELKDRLAERDRQIQQLQQAIEQITPLRRHIKERARAYLRGRRKAD